jgi:hypothetical protein
MANNDIYRNDDNEIAHEGGLENQIHRVSASEFGRKFGENFKSTLGIGRDTHFGEGLVDRIGDLGASVGGWIKDYAAVTGRTALAPYTIATDIRRANEDEYFLLGIMRSDTDHISADALGFITGMLSWFGQLVVYGYLISDSNPSGQASWGYLAIPVAANLADWLIYEPLRKTIEDIKNERPGDR